MTANKKVLDNILGIDITIKPYIPHKDCYVFYTHFDDDKSRENEYDYHFEITNSPAQLLKTVLELEIYKLTNKRRAYMAPNPELVFRPAHKNYQDNHWLWFEHHPNFSRKNFEPRFCATLDSYSIFYHDKNGLAHTVDFKLSPDFQKSIRSIVKECPEERDDTSCFNYREKAVVFLEQQLLLSQIEKQTENNSVLKLKPKMKI